MLLDELVARLTQLPEKSRTEAIDLALKSTTTMAWVPNPGPQTQAFLCEADELFYGRLGERQIDIAGCEQESDKQRFKGDPHDLIVFDEGTDFLESQYRFIIGWNRSTDPKQRLPSDCRE
jgi:hypothetical protein